MVEKQSHKTTEFNIGKLHLSRHESTQQGSNVPISRSVRELGLESCTLSGLVRAATTILPEQLQRKLNLSGCSGAENLHEPGGANTGS